MLEQPRKHHLPKHAATAFTAVGLVLFGGGGTLAVREERAASHLKENIAAEQHRHLGACMHPKSFSDMCKLKQQLHHAEHGEKAGGGFVLAGLGYVLAGFAARERKKTEARSNIQVSLERM